MASYMCGLWHVAHLLSPSLKEQTHFAAGHQRAILQIRDDDNEGRSEMKLKSGKYSLQMSLRICGRGQLCKQYNYD